MSLDDPRLQLATQEWVTNNFHRNDSDKLGDLHLLHLVDKDQPMMEIEDWASFLRAINDIKTGTAEIGSDGKYRIKMIDDIEINARVSSEFLIQNVDDVIILGNGHRIFRKTDQLKSRMINMINVNRFTFDNIIFDDGDDGVIGKTGATPFMILIQKSSDVFMNRTKISNSKGYSVYVRATKGFSFIESELSKAGILGMYIGHDNHQPSTGLRVLRSYFHDNSSNALAVQGVTREIQNIVQGNVFERNHLYGRWPVAPRFGTGMTGGGQVYLANVDNMEFTKNIIKNGRCLNCIDKSNKEIKNVTGLELSGVYGKEIRVRNLLITENEISDNDAYGIAQNENSTLDASTVIHNNDVYDNGKDFKLLDIKAS